MSQRDSTMADIVLPVGSKPAGLHQLQARVSGMAVVLTDSLAYLGVREETEATFLRFPNGD
ncbi:MAG: hypothetical protein RH980_09650 [Roseovarius confluentis]